MKPYFILILMCLALQAVEAKPLNINVKAESAILINADSGAILYEKKSHAPQYPASLTKIATALYTLKNQGAHLNKKVLAEHDAIATVSEEEMKRTNYSMPAYWLIPGASHIGIKKGEELSLKDLLYGMMVASGGDASNVIAQYMGGTIPVFMEELNRYLKEIGCMETSFKNPHGLHHPAHKTTAWDMARMTQEAMKDPAFCEIVKTVTYTRPDTNKQKATTLLQTNKLLRKGKYFYPKAIGVKTGFTTPAQNCVVAAAKEGDRRLIAVLMKSDERDAMFADAIKLFNAAFAEKKQQKILIKEGPMKASLMLKGAQKAVPSYVKEDVVLEYYPSEEVTVKCTLHWEDIALPVVQDQLVGMLSFKDAEGKEIKQEPLFAAESVDYSLWQRMMNVLQGSAFWKYLAGGAAFLVFLLLLLKIAV